MLTFSLLFSNKSTKNIDSKVIYTLFNKEHYKYVKTTHSYHLVDPSPWRAAVKRTMFSKTLWIQLKIFIFFLKKPLTRFFHFYTSNCLKITCLFSFLSLVGQAIKKIKNLLKSSLLAIQ